MLLLYDCYYFTICCYQHFTCIMPSPMSTLSQLTMPSLSTLHVWPHLYLSPSSCIELLLLIDWHHTCNNEMFYSTFLKVFFSKVLFCFLCVGVYFILFLCLCKLCEWLWVCVLCTYVWVLVCLYVYARFFLQDFLRIMFST